MEVCSDAIADSLVDRKLLNKATCSTESEDATNRCDENNGENKSFSETQRILIDSASSETTPISSTVLPEDPLQKKQDSASSTSPLGPTVIPEDLLQKELLDFLAGTNAHFKSQQLGDPDLTFIQKRTIADELLKRNPSQFLARFGTNIKSEHLQYFVPLRNDYEVDFYFKKLQRFHSKELHDVDIKNRRFEALQKLLSEGSYFSEEEMKSRNPLLYEQLIGQHLTTDERIEKAKDYSKMTYVGYLLDRMDRDSMNDLHQRQQDEEEGAIEENDTDDESCDLDEEDMDRELTEKEKDVLRQEFVTSMYNSFLEGKDVDFDYSSVDFNAEYDTHKDLEQDDEEKYFDSETPESLEEDKCVSVDKNMVEDEEDELDTYMNELK